MAIKSETRRDIDWILRDRKVIDGLDHLGIELVSVNLYQAMLPGVTNVTERARYYGFYPWTIHRYAQEGPQVRSKAAWRNWYRALDFTYAVACMAYEQDLQQELGSSVVGAERAGEVIKGEPPSAKIDLRGPSAVEDSGSVPQSGAYFKNPEGGLGQYYKGSLRDLGVVVEHGTATWPDVQLSNYAGKKIALALDKIKAFNELKELAIEGSARVGELSRHREEGSPECNRGRLRRGYATSEFAIWRRPVSLPGPRIYAHPVPSFLAIADAALSAGGRSH